MSSQVRARASTPLDVVEPRRRLSSRCRRTAAVLFASWVLASTGGASEDREIQGPPALPMTIPLPDPVFWDPTNAKGDYAIAEQESGIFLFRPQTGRVIARLDPTQGPGAQALGANPFHRPEPSNASILPAEGWPFRPGDEMPGAPVVVDTDGDGTLEVAFATRSGWVWILGRDGLPLAGWPVSIGSACEAGVAAADLDGDGRVEILTGDLQARVHALRIDGRALEGWPATIPGKPEMPGILASPACADLNRDGSVEVVVTQAAGRVCVFDAGGKVATGWPVGVGMGDGPVNAGTIFSRPAIADLNGDGSLEVIAGANNYRVHAWDARGNALRGWPRYLENRGRAGYADPVLADLTGDGKPEVVIATDAGFDGPARLYALNGDGKDVRGWPVDLPNRVNAGAAIGDVDGDGALDVVVATTGEDASVVVLDAKGKKIRGFPVGLTGMSVNASPVLADANGDGNVDIVVAALRARFEPATLVFGIDRRGHPIRGYPILLDGCEVVTGGPVVADVTGDGRLDLLVGTQVQGRLFAWSLEGSSAPGSAPWPRPGYDAANQGLYHRPGASRAAPVLPPEPETAPPEAPPPASPFPALSSVTFVLPQEGPVRLRVLNVQGELIRTLLEASLPTGSYTIAWDGTNGRGRRSPPGVYFYELELPDRRSKGQLLLLR